MKARGALLGCACALFAGCVSPAVARHPDLASRLPASARIAILPAASSALEVGYTGLVATLDSEADAAGKAAVEAVQSQLAARGHSVVALPLEGVRRFEITEVQLAAQRALSRLLRSESKQARDEYYGARSVLEPLVSLARPVNADALLFVGVSQEARRNGLGLVDYQEEVGVVLLDAWTGEVLYAAAAGRTSHSRDLTALATAALGEL